MMLLLILLGNFSSCEKNEPKDGRDLISSNLLKTGSIESALLIGEWDCIKFAYTVDGNTILDVTTISNAILLIPVAPTPIEHEMEDRWHLSCVNSNYFICSLSGNLVELQLLLKGSTYINVPDSHEENQILEALAKAYSFVIKDNELMIYFTGVENKNLLILKKK